MRSEVVDSRFQSIYGSRHKICLDWIQAACRAAANAADIAIMASNVLSIV
jgi:hypothetical protein